MIMSQTMTQAEGIFLMLMAFVVCLILWAIAWRFDSRRPRSRDKRDKAADEEKPGSDEQGRQV